MKAARYCCMILGTALLISALFLVLCNLYADRQGGEQAQAVLSALQGQMSELTTETTLPAQEHDTLFPDAADSVIPDMETAEVDGQAYIGTLSIPELGLELPVTAEYSDELLKTAPCRYAGSLYTDDLVIAAHNYNSHFGKIGRLHEGAELIFTDLHSRAYRFCVTETEQLAGTATDEMLSGSEENWDLTLFTCTLNGQNRVTVRAEKAE